MTTYATSVKMTVPNISFLITISATDTLPPPISPSRQSHVIPDDDITNAINSVEILAPEIFQRLKDTHLVVSKISDYTIQEKQLIY